MDDLRRAIDFVPLLTGTKPGSRLDKLFGLRALDDAGRELVRRYSPIHHLSRDMPPLLLIHGTNERLWAKGTAMRDRLREVGARHELVARQGAPHGMENWEGHPERAHYDTKLVQWLSVQFGSGAVHRAVALHAHSAPTPAFGARSEAAGCPVTSPIRASGARSGGAGCAVTSPIRASGARSGAFPLSSRGGFIPTRDA